jgi:hypothetical protein
LVAVNEEFAKPSHSGLPSVCISEESTRHGMVCKSQGNEAEEKMALSNLCIIARSRRTLVNMDRILPVETLAGFVQDNMPNYLSVTFSIYLEHAAAKKDAGLEAICQVIHPMNLPNPKMHTTAIMTRPEKRAPSALSLSVVLAAPPTARPNPKIPSMRSHCVKTPIV